MRSTVGDGLDVIRDAHAGLRLIGVGEAVVNILAQAEIEEPVAGLDLVFGEESQFLDVGVAEVV